MRQHKGFCFRRLCVRTTSILACKCLPKATARTMNPYEDTSWPSVSVWPLSSLVWLHSLLARWLLFILDHIQPYKNISWKVRAPWFSEPLFSFVRTGVFTQCLFQTEKTHVGACCTVPLPKGHLEWCHDTRILITISIPRKILYTKGRLLTPCWNRRTNGQEVIS